MPFCTESGAIWPGQRTMHGTRKPPSMIVPFACAKGVVPPSGQVNTSVPLSVVKTTMVLSSNPASFEVLHHEADVVVELRHAGFFDGPAILRVFIMACIFGREVGDDVHAGRVMPDEEWLAIVFGFVDETSR